MLSLGHVGQRLTQLGHCPRASLHAYGSRDNRSMLTKLTLRNFQAHKRMDIPLHAQVTTIVGASDVGKSSVVRALRWLILNKPSGNAFVRKGAKRAIVKLFLGDSKAITRVRSSGTANAYAFEVKGKKARYKAFGSGVPPAIQDALRIEELNFQSQHDSPFWFSESAGEVSKSLNAVVDLSLMDDVLRRLGSEVRKQKDRVAVSKEALAEARETFQKLRYVPGFCLELKEVRKLFAVWKTLFVQVGELREGIQKVKDARKTAEEPVPDFSRVEKANRRLTAVRTDKEELLAFLDQVRAARKTERFAAIKFEEAEKRFHHNIKGQKCPLCKKPM